MKAHILSAIRYLAMLAPPAFIAAIIYQNNFNIPFAEEWVMLPLIEKYHEGTLAFHDFWIQYNEHRMLFPKLIIFAMALASGWNINVEVYSNILITVITLYFIYLLLRMCMERELSLWVMVLFSFIKFMREGY